MAQGASQAAELLVCVKCRKAGAVAEEDAAEATRAGRDLYDALADRTLPEGLSLVPVECLQNCKRGCTVALRGGDRWTYVYGELDAAEHVDTLIEGAGKYLATADGLIPWRHRPEPFKRNCVARVPPPAFAATLAADTTITDAATADTAATPQPEAAQ